MWFLFTFIVMLFRGQEIARAAGLWAMSQNGQNRMTLDRRIPGEPDQFRSWRRGFWIEVSTEAETHAMKMNMQS
jgi:hypothetical protein